MTEGTDVPVVLLAFNRPSLTRRVFDAIASARPSHLFVVCDGPRKDHPGDDVRCEEVRQIASLVDWPCHVSMNVSPRNLGCGLRVSSGLDWVFRSVDRAIILEDDCLPGADFFEFCKEMLAFYENDSRIGTIAGTNLAAGIERFPGSYLFTKYFACWGWATWRRSWATYDWRMADLRAAIGSGILRAALGRDDASNYFAAAFNRAISGEVDSWAYPMLFHSLTNNWLHVIPTRNLVSNIGFGSDSTHTSDHDSPFANLPIEVLSTPIRHNRFVGSCPKFDATLERHHFGLYE